MGGEDCSMGQEERSSSNEQPVNDSMNKDNAETISADFLAVFIAVLLVIVIYAFAVYHETWQTERTYIATDLYYARRDADYSWSDQRSALAEELGGDTLRRNQTVAGLTVGDYQLEFIPLLGKFRLDMGAKSCYTLSYPMGTRFYYVEYRLMLNATALLQVHDDGGENRHTIVLYDLRPYLSQKEHAKKKLYGFSLTPFGDMIFLFKEAHNVRIHRYRPEGWEHACLRNPLTASSS